MKNKPLVRTIKYTLSGKIQPTILERIEKIVRGGKLWSGSLLAVYVILFLVVGVGILFGLDPVKVDTLGKWLASQKEYCIAIWGIIGFGAAATSIFKSKSPPAPTTYRARGATKKRR